MIIQVEIDTEAKTFAMHIDSMNNKTGDGHKMTYKSFRFEQARYDPADENPSEDLSISLEGVRALLPFLPEMLKGAQGKTELAVKKRDETQT